MMCLGKTLWPFLHKSLQLDYLSFQESHKGNCLNDRHVQNNIRCYSKLFKCSLMISEIDAFQPQEVNKESLKLPGGWWKRLRDYGRSMHHTSHRGTGIGFLAWAVKKVVMNWIAWSADIDGGGATLACDEGPAHPHSRESEDEPTAAPSNSGIFRGIYLVASPAAYTMWLLDQSQHVGAIYHTIVVDHTATHHILRPICFPVTGWM